MLTDRDRELIASAVDGELTPATEPAFRALVADSAEALGLFHAYTVQARRVAALPKRAAPAELLPNVLARLGERPVVVLKPLPADRRRSAGWRVPAAVAAGLIAAAAGAWVAVPKVERRPVGPVAVQPAAKPAPRPEGPPAAVAANDPDPAPEAVPPDAPRVEVAAAPEVAPAPRAAADPDVVGGVQFGPAPAFAVVQARGPALFQAADLDRADVKARVLADLARDPAHRADLFARDPARAFEQMQAALKAAGVHLAADPALAERLKKRQPAGWAVYTEAVPAAELAQLFARLADPARKPSPAVTALHLYPAAPADGREFRELLGVDRAVWKRPRTPAGVAGATADSVAAAVGKPPKAALAVPVFPAGARPNPLLSADVKAFWQKLGAASGPGPALLIVCRGA